MPAAANRKIVLVHGWSVQNTNTYGGFPAWLAKQRDERGNRFEISDVYLSKYVSFEDSVTLDDISRAFNSALGAVIGPHDRFACITHSTGGPVVRNWITTFTTARN